MPNRHDSLVWSCISSGALLAAALLGGTASTLAQDNPELGDVRHNPPPAAASANASVSVRVSDSSGPFDGEVATRGNDHALVIGHLGVGAFGAVQLPVANDVMGQSFNGYLNAPTLGARYWLNERLGIEGGLAIGFTTGGTTTETTNAAGSTSVTINDPSLFGMGLHGGLPLVFASSAHFAFELIPEINLGFVTGSQGDTNLSGFLLQLGARVGAEIQFGFIGIPQLALQGTVGFHLAYEGRSASTDNVETSSHSFGFGTSLQGEPWDIFTGALTAIYYL